MRTEANEPAFPADSHGSGLTKLEYFAAKALQGLLAATDEEEEFNSLTDYAAAAVSAAYVLIEALNKPVQS